MGPWSFRAVLIAGLLAGGGVAQARDCDGVGFPDQVKVAGTALALNGLGVRKATIFKVKVYVAALYLAVKSTDPTAILALPGPAQLDLSFVRDVGAGDITDAWTDGFANAANGQLAALADRIATLNGWMEGIKAGEALRFTLIPGSGTRVSVRGTEKGLIKGDDFARALLAIWLGADPPNADLKAGLLGGACP